MSAQKLSCIIRIFSSVKKDGNGNFSENIFPGWKLHSFYGKSLGKCDFVQSNPCRWGNENLCLRQRKFLHGSNLQKISSNLLIRDMVRWSNDQRWDEDWPSKIYLAWFFEGVILHLMDAAILMTFCALLLRAICHQVYPQKFLTVNFPQIVLDELHFSINSLLTRNLGNFQQMVFW